MKLKIGNVTLDNNLIDVYKRQEEAAGLIGIKPEEVEAWYKEMKAGKGI